MNERDGAITEEWAHVWPEGGLFAFSGVDGETRHGEPFVAAGTRDGIGWRFWLKPRLSLLANVGETRLAAHRDPADFCLSDCWRCATSFGDWEGVVEGAFVDCASMTVSIAFDALPEGIYPTLGADIAMEMDTDEAVFAGQGYWVAVCSTTPSSTRQFGVAISYAHREEAVERACNARAANLAGVIEQRLAFYRAVPVPESASGQNRRAYYKAVSIHKVNIESAQQDIPCRWTTPDRMPHRHMWLWDTAFHSLGLARLDPALARDALRALFSKQRDDGKLLLAVQPGQPPREAGNNSPPTEEDTQPPILAWALWTQQQDAPDRDFLEEIYPKLVRYVEWFERNRALENGLYGWRIRTNSDPIRCARGGESGMDNSPRFDNVSSMTAVDLCSYLASEYRALAKIARVVGEAGDAPEWLRRHARIAEQVNALLWDDEDQFYYDLDEQGAFVTVKTTAGLMPLLAGFPDGDRAEALRMHLMNPNEFWAPVPASSVSQDEPCFSYDMWRGPAWPNVNVLLYHGLMDYRFMDEARALARATLREIVRHYLRHGCFYEYYDAMAVHEPADLPRKGAPGELGGVGFGVVEDLQWTAAAFVHLGHEIGY